VLYDSAVFYRKNPWRGTTVAAQLYTINCFVTEYMTTEAIVRRCREFMQGVFINNLMSVGQT